MICGQESTVRISEYATMLRTLEGRPQVSFARER